MSRIETVKSDVDQHERVLRDDELDAVSGGAPRGGEPVKYMEYKLTDILISSV